MSGSVSGKIFTAVLLAVLAYAVYSWYSTRSVDPFDINSQQYAEATAQAPPVEASLTRVVSPGGPGAPNQRPPPEEAVRMPEEAPYDPQAQPYESATIPERLRHPERMFGPGLVNEDTDTAVAAGTASYATQKTMESYQTFGPEFAQNGGAFMEENGVVANDSSVDLSYSAA